MSVHQVIITYGRTLKCGQTSKEESEFLRRSCSARTPVAIMETRRGRASAPSAGGRRLAQLKPRGKTRGNSTQTFRLTGAFTSWWFLSAACYRHDGEGVDGVTSQDITNCIVPPLMITWIDIAIALHTHFTHVLFQYNLPLTWLSNYRLHVKCPVA